jgi:serine/threonine protein kinase
VPTESDNLGLYTLALRPGTLLDGAYRITQVLGDTSTFAITYLARNERGTDHVVIKELLPRTLAGRARDGLTVVPHSPNDEGSLSRVLRRFGREAELLADVAHPNIPRVRRHFEANGTAYVVFHYYEGKTLGELAAATEGRLRPERATGLIVQVLQGLEALHAEGIVHGFVTPDSILVDDNSRCLILGLGTTRHVVGPAREPLAGFAPIEQYAAKEVGPWTDVYACAAVLYRLTSGLMPPSAVERSTGAALPMPWTAADVPAPLTHSILSAMAQLPDARPHSAEEFRRRLEASLSPASSRTPPQFEQRINTARRPTPEPAQAVPVVTLPDAEPASESRFDYEAFLENSDGPTDRVRRLFRMVLGVGGATAGLLLAVSLLGSRTDSGSAGGDVVAAAPLPPTLSSSRGPTPRVERPAPPSTVELRSSRVTSSASPVRQASSTVARAPRVDLAAAAPARTAGAPARPNGSSSPVSADAGRANAPITAPSVSVSVPASVGTFELLPSEVLTGLRERLAHGKENMESGEYARARQIYRAALDQIGKLNDRYAGAQALLSVRQDLEQAAERALAACTAENEVAAKRNATPVPCQ